jgi:hypothetical protein
VILAGSQIAFSYIDDQRVPGTPGRHRLVCLDPKGNERWSIRDYRLELALRDEWFVGVTRAGELRVVDVDGRQCDGIRDGRKKAVRKEVLEVRRWRDGLIVRTATDVFVVDASLMLVERFPAPVTNSNLILVDGALMYVERKRVMRADRHGRTTIVCDVPTEMADDAMTRWEKETGIAALDGVWMVRCDPKSPDPDSAVAKGKVLGLGDRPLGSAWYLHSDDVAGSLFLVNHIQPHVVIALQSDGQVQWCTYLSPHCCGGAPVRLANGELVVSSGCGGGVSWLDSTGQVLRQSAGWGMLNRDIRTLADSSCVIAGGSCLAFWRDGTLRWNRTCSSFGYDEGHGLLVTANGTSREETPRLVTLTCLENLDGALRGG